MGGRGVGSGPLAQGVILKNTLDVLFLDSEIVRVEMVSIFNNHCMSLERGLFLGKERPQSQL